MLIVSWNVASWRLTLKYIKQWYGNVECWLDRHGIDILALQEVKVQANQIESRPDEISADIPGFDTFWCCCKKKKNVGFNGTATIARKGLTIGAECTPLGDDQTGESFDDEGRCIVTDHGKFVIFNVYVPNSGA